MKEFKEGNLAKRDYLFGWWFQTFFIFTPTWGNDPILIQIYSYFQMG